MKRVLESDYVEFLGRCGRINAMDTGLFAGMATYFSILYGGFGEQWLPMIVTLLALAGLYGNMRAKGKTDLRRAHIEWVISDLVTVTFMMSVMTVECLYDSHQTLIMVAYVAMIISARVFDPSIGESEEAYEDHARFDDSDRATKQGWREYNRSLGLATGVMGGIWSYVIITLLGVSAELLALVLLVIAGPGFAIWRYVLIKKYLS